MEKITDTCTISESGIQGQDTDNFSDTTSFTSDLSELSKRNVELDEQVSSLRSQIDRYETEIEQFEMLRSDWQNEKEALEGVLVQLREQLKEKENSLAVVEAQKVCSVIKLVYIYLDFVICRLATFLDK